MTTIILLLIDKHEAFSPVRFQQRRGQQNSFSVTKLDYDLLSSSSSLSNKINASSAAPIYITIGPPCSGKTEALRQILFQDGYDPDLVFSDQEVQLSTKAYRRVSLEGFLFPNSTHLEGGEETLFGSTTVKDRLLDPTFERSDQELRHVLLRVAGRISEEEFQQRAKELGNNNYLRTKVYEDLCMAVEQVNVQAVSEVICQLQFLQDVNNDDQEELPYDDEGNNDNNNTNPQIDYSSMNATQAHLLSARALIKTPHVELFVPQHVMNRIPEAEEQLSGLLEKSAEYPVFWSNTNSRPMEYVAALEAAQAAGRPVEFCAWRIQWEVDRVELLRRNVARFRKTGRYIPAGAVSASLGRVIRLVNCAEQLYKKQLEKKVEFDMNAAFCELAGFRRDIETGLVTKVGPPLNLKPRPQQKYRRRTPYKRPEFKKRPDLRRQRRKQKEIQRQKREDLRSYIQQSIERKAKENRS